MAGWEVNETIYCKAHGKLEPLIPLAVELAVEQASGGTRL